jgi:hypothetical protein
VGDEACLWSQTLLPMAVSDTAGTAKGGNAPLKVIDTRSHAERVSAHKHFISNPFMLIRR